ncbi:hypothetical protein SAMN05216490_3567 [Mucilaginibacter mallensis]|uniref:Uncharacterized protein n=1 Tax=Mucilaginibacter mallensis TaxID=652787 RepID=A0A1H2AJH4_MUCMA|nr:hypothetical protein [Mucilaginibacter mallensis]SDT46101.1 hypothetical protein SAMN05216490_3567 [Mucilaginibacter mallensis]
MKLDYWDLDCIHTRMKSYDIKYQEIYNELFDHIVTAIEEKRAVDNSSSIERLYTEVVDTQFGGYSGIERVAKSHEDGYKKKVMKLVWGNFRHYLNYQSLIFTAVLIGISFTLPPTKLTAFIIAMMMIVVAIHSSAYAYIKLRRIKPSKGKTSLVYSHTIAQANLPMMFLYTLVWLPRLPAIFNDTYKRTLPHFHPAILAFELALVLIYDMSCMRLCQQELKGFVDVNPNALD